MITVFIYGLDQFVVGDLSREIAPLLAKNYEVEEDEINFVAPNNMVFHNGAEQTSWNVIINVHAPLKVKVLEQQAAKIILELVKGVCIHISLEFYYYSQDNRYVYINPKYPRYLEDDSSSDYENYESEELEEGDGEDQIYTGDIFKEHEDGCCNCDDDCDCDGECDCDGHCECGHDHKKH